MSALWMLFVSLLFHPVLPCYHCFIEMSDTMTLCHALSFTVQVCFDTIHQLVSHNPRVVEAGKVGPGHDTKLKDILMDEINAIKDEYEKNRVKQDEKRLRRFAENFIAAASKLPRAKCTGKCGFQPDGPYDCSTCNFRSCGLPIDCEFKVLKVVENQRVHLKCEVEFPLPGKIAVVWRYADGVKTRLLTEFEDLTAGVDPNLTIPMVREEHQGTYQCALYSEEVSADIIRLFFFLEVEHKIRPSDLRMQKTFDMAMAPGGELRIREPLSRPWVLSDVALISLFTNMFLTVFLHITVICLLSSGQDFFDVDDDDDEDYIYHYYPQQSDTRRDSHDSPCQRSLSVCCAGLQLRKPKSTRSHGHRVAS
ncbi:sperm acrosome membrane-associated protein 6 isoform 2-T2 [Synchiropus picturatus]